MIDDNKIDIKQQGMYLRAWRRFKQFSEGELALRVGLTASTIRAIESGKRRLTPLRLLDVAKALAISPDDLQHMPTAKQVSHHEGSQESSDGRATSTTDTLERLERLLDSAVSTTLEKWAREQREKERKHAIDHHSDMLRRILLRAGHSGPAEYPKRYTPEGELYQPIEGSEEIVRFAIRLLGAAAMTNAPRNDRRRNTILITWRGDQDPIGAVGDSYLRLQWVAALRAAFARGWYVKHCIQLNRNHHKALRSVLNVLALTGPTGRYEPVLSNAESLTPSSEPEPDFVWVPDQGCLVLYGSNTAHFFPPNTKSFQQWYDTISELMGNSRELYTNYGRLETDRIEAISTLEENEGDRYLFIDGLPQNLIPEPVQKARLEAVEEILADKRKLAQPLLQDALDLVRATYECRVDRERVILKHLEAKRCWIRDICSEQAIRRLVESGRTSLGDINDTFSILGGPYLPPLTLEQRRSVLSALVDRLIRYPKYELVLMDDTDAIRGAYCLIKAGQGVLLQFWKLVRSESQLDENGEILGPRPRDYITIQFDDPTVIEAFVRSPMLRRYRYGSAQPYTKRVEVIDFLKGCITWLDERIDAELEVE